MKQRLTNCGACVLLWCMLIFCGAMPVLAEGDASLGEGVQSEAPGTPPTETQVNSDPGTESQNADVPPETAEPTPQAPIPQGEEHDQSTSEVNPEGTSSPVSETEGGGGGTSSANPEESKSVESQSEGEQTEIEVSPIEGASTTPDQVLGDEELPVIPPIMLEEMPGQENYFGLNDEVSFALKTAVPFPMPLQHENDDHPVSEKTLTEHIVETVSDMVQATADSVESAVLKVSEGISSTVDVVIDSVTDIFSETGSSTQVVMNEDVGTVPDTSEKEVLTVTDDSNYTPHVAGFVDGKAVETTFEVQNDTTLRVILHGGFSFGAHRIRVEVTYKNDSYFWDGEFTWGGDVLSSLTIEPGTVVVVRGKDGLTSLWFSEYTTETPSYQLLDDQYIYSSSSPLSYFDGTIFWPTHQGDSLYGYSVLSHTIFSQTLERNNTQDITLNETEYIVKQKTDSYSFVPAPNP